MKLADPELVDRLAAAYVLGTMRRPARRRFETLLRSRPDLRTATRAWERRLEHMLLSLAAVPPPRDLWRRIRVRLRSRR